MRAFVAVAEARSSSRASHELLLTQPAAPDACSASNTPSASSSAIGGDDPSRSPPPVMRSSALHRVLHAVGDIVPPRTTMPWTRARSPVSRTPSPRSRSPSRGSRLARSHASRCSLATSWSGPDRAGTRALSRRRHRAAPGFGAPAARPGATRPGQERLVVVAARRGAPHTLDRASLGGVRWILNPEGCAARALLQRPCSPKTSRCASPSRPRPTIQLALVARERGLGLGPGPHPRPEPPPRVSACGASPGSIFR